MAESLGLRPPDPLVIDITSTSMSLTWDKWIETLEMYFLAANIADPKRKKALLLYLGGEELRKIHGTLEDDQETFDDTKRFLEAHFKPKLNVTYERNKFYSTYQNENESISSFVTRLRDMSKTCSFDTYSPDNAVVDQVISKCISSKLRRRLLREDNIDLKTLLKLSHSVESADVQASAMEKNEERLYLLRKAEHSSHEVVDEKVHALHKRDTKPKNNRKCFGCGDTTHFYNSFKCPAKGENCSFCKGKNHFASSCFKRKEKEDSSTSNEHSGTYNEHSDIKRALRNIEIQSDSDDEYLFAILDEKKTDVVVSLDNCKVKFMIDSGASCNIIDSDTFDMICKKTNIPLRDTSTKVYVYGSDRPMKLRGCFISNVLYNNHHDIIKVLVSSAKNSGCLLSRSTAQKLGMININVENLNNISMSANDSLRNEVKEIIHHHQGIFNGLGKLKDVQLKLNIDTNVKPIAQHLRRIPFHVRKKVQEKLDELLELDIIEPVTGPTPWVSPLLAVCEKEKTRIVLDLRQANKAIKRSHHPIPTLDELLDKFNGCTVFSKVDLKHGYHQIELEPESRNITTFSTHRGLYRYKRLVQGASSAFEDYQHAIGQLFRDQQRIANISDDILIGGINETDHDENLKKCLNILAENNLTLKESKCEFSKREIEFYGFKISADGISPTRSKIEAVQNFGEPQNPNEVRSFLGLINYLARFVPNLASETETLRLLTRKEVIWKWGMAERKAFLHLKEIVGKDTTMSHFDQKLNSYLIVDAGPVGLGAILAQEQSDHSIRPVAYASRTLSKPERRYSQTEKEALAVVWGCERFHLYLYGSTFTIRTDHLPLKIIYSPKGKPSPRVLRWGLRLQSYDFTIEHIKGSTNPADILSRQPLDDGSQEIESELTENFVNCLIANAIPKAITLTDVINHSREDYVLQKVIQCIKTDKWPKEKELKPYYSIRSQLTYKGNILIKDGQIIIPSNLRKRTLKIAHEGHQGITKTKALLREKVWWPCINNQVEDEVKGCVPCLSVGTPDSREPVIMSEMPDPWHTLHIDMYGPMPSGEYILGIIDASSRWPEIHIIRNTTSKVITKKLDLTFSTHGYPLKIVTDNGPNLVSVDVKSYCEIYGIDHRKVAPYWPQANAEIERFYRTLGKAIRTATLDGHDWREAVFKFLFNYRCTPHSTTKIAPAKLLMGRDLRGKLPQIEDEQSDILKQAKNNDSRMKAKAKSYADKRFHCKPSNIQKGDFVLVKQKKKNKLSANFGSTSYFVKERQGPVAILTRNGREIMRNIHLLKKIPKSAVDHSDDELECSAEILDDPQQLPPVRRSGRDRHAPNRYGDYDFS